jgi:hypothetical protein
MSAVWSKDALLLLVPLLLCACGQTQGDRAVQREMQDDTACTKMLAERGQQGNQSAYAQCRQNLVEYRQSIGAEGGSEPSLGERLQHAGKALRDH